MSLQSCVFIFVIRYRANTFCFINNKKRKCGSKITQGFKIETSLSTDKYNLLRKILNIPKGKNSPFSTNAFFSELNSIFPSKLSESGKIDNNILNKIYNFEESDKYEYDGLIDWSKSNSGKHHTVRNHEKTRILYPDIYDMIKGKDISVRYK